MIEKHVTREMPHDQVIALMVHLDLSGLLQSMQNEYFYWDKVKYKSLQYDNEEVWTALKFHRFLKGTIIKFGKYDFTYSITNYILKTLHQFDLNIGGNLGSNIGIAEIDKAKFITSTLTEEAISSSQMEGAHTTRKKAKEMIQKQQKPQNKSEQMIMNNFITMKHIVQHKNDKITPEGILNIHTLICNKTLDDLEDEGKFRNNNEITIVDHIKSTVVYIPPPADELENLVSELCDFCNNDNDIFIHPIIKGCILHFMIGWIHPFVDGNGRTARAMFYWYMLKKGYWLTEFLSISRIIQDTKSQYEKAYLYTETDDNDLGYFITYHLKTMQRAFEALKEYISRKQSEIFQAAEFLKIEGVNERTAQLIKLINDDAERILNVKEVETRFNISNFTARSDLKSLVELGLLQIVNVNKKKQNFIKPFNFDNKLKQLFLQTKKPPKNPEALL